MFYAINKETKETVKSTDINISEKIFQTYIWYADPLKIENCPNEIDKTKIQAYWRKGSDKVINKFATIYSISPHFFIPNATKKGIIIKKSNPDHEKCENFIYNLIKQKKISFKISTQKKKDNVKENILKLDSRKFDISKSDVEVIIKSRGIKIADICLPFKKFDSFLGFGIIIEIQLTKQKEHIEQERSFERANKGYSLVWLKTNHFEDITSKDLFLKDKILEVMDFTSQLQKYRNACQTDIKDMTINFSTLLDKKEERIEKLLEVMRTTPLPCQACKGYLQRKKGQFGEFYGCSNFKNIGCTFKLSIK